MKIGICLDIEGKTIIITGGSKGIGKGCAMTFANQGANVVIGARGESEGLAVEQEIKKNSIGDCTFVQCDVSEEEDVKRLIEMSVNKYNDIYCLINNAGYLPPRRPLDDIPLQDYLNVLRTNLVSYFLTCKYALPYIRAAGGSVINIGSVIGETGQEGSTLYCSTKGGIVSFTQSAGH